MAVTQIHAIKTTLVKAINYIRDPDKTDDNLLICGVNCTPETAAIEFEMTKKSADKRGGVLAHHLIQSFAPGDNLTNEQAHEIGKRLIAQHLQGKYECIIATHCDKLHIHNHIIFNSVPLDGKNKYRETIPNYFKIREISDKLCLEHSLSIIEPSGERGKSYTEYKAAKQGVSWKSRLRETIESCIKKARNFDEFIRLMQAKEYEVKRGKHISFRAKGQEKFTRAKALGDRYSESNIMKQLQCEAKSNTVDAAALIDKHDKIKAAHKSILARIKEVEKRIKELEEQIKDIETFRKYKPITYKLDTVIFKEKYKREHETEFILFNAAKQSLKVHFPNIKYPLIKELRAEINELYNEKNKLYPEYYEIKHELENISSIKKNIDFVLEKPREIEKELNKNDDIHEL